VGLARFKSLTLRCFKLPQLEDRCEEYGQFITYLGTLPETTRAFVLDQQGHTFEKGRPYPVCGNTALMVRLCVLVLILTHTFIPIHPCVPTHIQTPNPLHPQQTAVQHALRPALQGHGRHEHALRALWGLGHLRAARRQGFGGLPHGLLLTWLIDWLIG
jgi:hypothetical protein